MRAVVYTEYGDPGVLKVTEAGEPHAGLNQIRVRVRAAGINPVDWKVVAGLMAGGAPLAQPTIPGFDVAGVVDEVGDGVEGVAVGQAVLGQAMSGSAAEFAVLEEWAVKPDAVSWEIAGALNVAGETAVRALDVVSPGSGATLLVDGAAGGVGLIISQLALTRGVTVLGTASAGNHDLLRSLGVVPLEYGDGFVERARVLAPNGVDYAIDTAGKGSIPGLIELTGAPERVVTIADYGAGEQGVHVSAVPANRARSLALLAGLVAEGKLQIPIGGTYGLDQLADAYRLSQAGHVAGKLVLVP